VTTAWVVIDLGFGDSGKGTITDWLVRTGGAKLVVRWNGGAQAGHNVVTADGRHHTFSQFGAGSFVPGVRTHLSEEMVVHPTALLVEENVLRSKGVEPELTIAESARIITPWHQAAGRIRELALGHGTCGVGVGEAVRDALDHPDDVLRARDLLGDARAKLRRIRERLRPPEGDDPRAVAERRVLEDPDLERRWADAVAPVRTRIVPDEIRLDGPVVLEGAHGVLLDEWRGFHPHTTWHSCTSGAATSWLSRHGLDGEVKRLGVLRTYLTRHGAGPFPTETKELTFAEHHNDSSGYQGPFRLGWPDVALAKYALAVSDVDGLALTHCDRNVEFAALRYEGVTIEPGPPRDLAHQVRLTRTLFNAKPVLERIYDDVAFFEGVLGRKVWVTSHGPTAADKRSNSRTP